MLGLVTIYIVPIYDIEEIKKEHINVILRQGSSVGSAPAALLAHPSSNPAGRGSFFGAWGFSGTYPSEDHTGVYRGV